MRGAPHSGLARLMSRISWRISVRHLWPAAATSRLPSPEQTKPGAMPTDNGLRLHGVG